MPKEKPADPILSFYIPVYKKSPDVFRRCLKSLFDQSLKKIEVIAVFDGPDAALQLVAAEFPSVEVVLNDHAGAPRARNKGLSLCLGKYVVAWDADCRIKPDAAKRWVEEFEATGCDFVYTDYDLPEGMNGFVSEAFDRYSLECGNYISTMSPILRSKAPKWDESLVAGQDWDYFLTATENGCKGVYIEGASFITEAAGQDDISPQGLSGPNRDAIIRQIRFKHCIPERSIGVFSTSYRAMAIKVARVLGADVIKMTGLTPTVYPTIFNLGYGFMSRFDGIPESVTKIQYWLPGEIEGLATRQYSIVKSVIATSKKVINLCGTDYEKNKLSEFGIDADVSVLPLLDEDLTKLGTELPEKFKVLVATDKAYADLLKDLSVDLPHIEFVYNAARMKDVSCFLSFYQFAALDTAMVTAHVNGRNVISNVSAPYCGYIDPDQSWEKFKKELYEKIREVKTKPFNQTAKDCYLDLADPEKFKAKIIGYSEPKLEVLSA